MVDSDDSDHSTLGEGVDIMERSDYFEHTMLRKREDTALKDALGQILDSGAYSDMKLLLSDQTEIRCHRAIMSKRCDFFRKALESGFEETYTGVIKMFYQPPEAVRAMVRYLYTADYLDNNPKDPDPLFHLDVYIIAGIYLLKGLADVARCHIRLHCHKGTVPISLANPLRDCKMAFGKLHRADEFYNDFIEAFITETHCDQSSCPELGYLKSECPDFLQDVIEIAWKLWKTHGDFRSALWLARYEQLANFVWYHLVKCPGDGCGYVNKFLHLPTEATAPRDCEGCGNRFTSKEWLLAIGSEPEMKSGDGDSGEATVDG